jgi:serine/threonine protein kinase
VISLGSIDPSLETSSSNWSFHFFTDILVSRNLRAMITDFGSTRELNSFMTMQVGTFLWMAPEVVAKKKYSFSADVFSYGLILYELFMGSLPRRTLKQQLAGVTPEFDLSLIHKAVPKDIMYIYNRCCAEKESARPVMSEVAERLDGILDCLEDCKSTWKRIPKPLLPEGMCEQVGASDRLVYAVVYCARSFLLLQWRCGSVCCCARRSSLRHKRNAHTHTYPSTNATHTQTCVHAHFLPQILSTPLGGLRKTERELDEEAKTNQFMRDSMAPKKTKRRDHSKRLSLIHEGRRARATSDFVLDARKPGGDGPGGKK